MALDTIKEVRSWLTPILVIVTSFLIKAKLSDIEAKMNQVDQISGQVIALQVKQAIIETKLNQLDGQFHTHAEMMGLKEEQKNLHDLLNSEK